MYSNYSIFQYQFCSGELEMGERPLKRKEALERVMIEDYLRENKLVFTSTKRNVEFKREYMWIPEPDGVVTVFKLGYERKSGVDKSLWSVKKLMDFPHCVIVISLKESSPYILVWGYENAFKSGNEVMEILADALETCFNGRGVSMSVTPINKDREAERWMKHMLGVYKKAKKHKEKTIAALNSFEARPAGGTSDFRSCIVDSEKADAIIALIRKYMKDKKEAQDIFMSVVAAVKAEVLLEPSWPEVASEFNLDETLRSSFYRLMRVGCKSYDSPAFGAVVKKFKAL